MPGDAGYQETGWKWGETGNLMSHHPFGPFALAHRSHLRAHPHIHDGQTTVTVWFISQSYLRSAPNRAVATTMGSNVGDAGVIGLRNGGNIIGAFEDLHVTARTRLRRHV